MLTKNITIINKLGLHARAASKLVDTACRYSAEIQLHKEDLTANAKSIMGIMLLAATQGTKLNITAEGKDADEALDAICQLINDKFGEGQ